MSMNPETVEAANQMLESLVSADRALSAEQIAQNSGIELREARLALASLTAAGLIQRASANHGFLYKLNSDLTAYDLVRTVETGVDVDYLIEKGVLSAKQKQAALSLSTQSNKLRELEEESLAIKEKSRPQAHVPVDAAAVALERLMEAAAAVQHRVGGADAAVKTIEQTKSTIDEALQQQRARSLGLDQVLRASGDKKKA